MLLECVRAPQAVQFAQTERDNLAGVVGHQLDVLEVPVEILFSDAGRCRHFTAIGHKPVME